MVKKEEKVVYDVVIKMRVTQSHSNTIYMSFYCIFKGFELIWEEIMILLRFSSGMSPLYAVF